jgi:hypothetical protein
MRGAPWNYLARCEAALAAFENGGELPPVWTMPPVRSEDDYALDDALKTTKTRTTSSDPL